MGSIVQTKDLQAKLAQAEEALADQRKEYQ